MTKAMLQKGPAEGLRFAVRRLAAPGPVGPDGVTEAERIRVDLYGTARSYRALGEFFVALSWLESNASGELREDFEDLVSLDGGTRVHLVVRRHRG